MALDLSFELGFSFIKSFPFYVSHPKIEWPLKLNDKMLKEICLFIGQSLKFIFDINQNL